MIGCTIIQDDICNILSQRGTMLETMCRPCTDDPVSWLVWVRSNDPVRIRGLGILTGLYSLNFCLFQCWEPVTNIFSAFLY